MLLSRALALLLLPYAMVSGQSTMDGLPDGAEAWFLPTDDGTGELFVYEIGGGRGDPVVVLHGGPGGELSLLLPIAKGLEREFHFVFYDQRGSMRSRALIDSISMASHVRDLETLRVALGAERMRLLSHSAGTMLAFEYLKAHPDRVSQLVLAGALPHKNGQPYFDAEYAALWEGHAENSRQFEQRPEIAEAIRASGLDSTKGPKQRARVELIRQVGGSMFRVDRWRDWIPMRVSGPAARRTRETTNWEYDHGPMLASHPYQVTVINGEFDYTVGPRGSPLWKRLQDSTAPRLRVVVIPNAAHVVWLDDPEAVRVALRNALMGH